MTDNKNPSLIAREVLRELATQRRLPTPENYRELYLRIAGMADEELFPERNLRQLAATLPRALPEQLRLAQQIDQAIAESNWPLWRNAMSKFAQLGGETAPTVAPRPGAVVTARGLAEAPEAWRQILAQALESAIGMLLIDTPELDAEAKALAAQLRDPSTEENDTGFRERLTDFAYRVQWVVEDQSQIRNALLRLLQLIIENVGELVVDEQWLHGQMAALSELFTRPLDKHTLEELGNRLQEVIYRQGVLKRSLNDARDRLKEMLAGFVDQLGHFSLTTGSYQGKMEAFSRRIASASALPELSDVIVEIMSETRQVQREVQRSQAELLSLRERVDAANDEIARLQRELEQASEMVRHDPLTGALNRKGLEETLEREIARMRRRGSSLCLALLDVDNFKALNDNLGHRAGDEALVHLANVIRGTLRPQDAVARYGGEEFLILLPDTTPEDGVRVIERLQRELTRRFFLHDNQKLLITFSAGLTRVGNDEDPEAALARADQAMYRAKREGKNRVCLA